MDRHFDVVIVGAGIGGAVLALDLGRRGWRVALVERERAPIKFARPEILWGPTVNALESLGVAQAIRTANIPLREIEIGNEKPWLRLTPDDLAGARVEAFSTNPALTRKIISDAATATGTVETFRGVTVTDVLRGDGRVVGVRGKNGDDTDSFLASLVVGDDGGQSVVRTNLGIPMPLAPFPVEFISAMLPRWPLPRLQGRVWIQLKGNKNGPAAAAFIPWPENEGILLLPVATGSATRLLEQSPEDFWRAFGLLTPLSAGVREQIEFPRDFRNTARPFGHAASYVADGVALIGDAVHQMTPAGGQGANASIWDALALADVAADALKAGDVSKTRLSAYEHLRRPINDQSISISRQARRVFRVGRHLPLATLLPFAARTINSLNWPKQLILRRFSTAFTHPLKSAP